MNTTQRTIPAWSLSVSKTLFGKMPDGVSVDLYRLTNRNGMVVSVITYGARVQADHEQLKYAEPTQGGYDFNWILDSNGDIQTLAVRVTDPDSGRTVEMYTTEPGVQFYTSNFLDNSFAGKNSKIYAYWGGFTLEAQYFPDSVNQPDFPSTVLAAGQKYTQTTIYKFLCE